MSRLTVAFGGGTVNVHDLLQAMSTVTSRIHASLRVASFFIRPTTAFAGNIEESAEDLVMASWAADAKTRYKPLGRARRRLRSATSTGDCYRRWVHLAAALEDVPWDDGDLLVIGSSSSGPLAQVFLGSRASKIIRHSPVPVVTVPRAVGDELVAAEPISATVSATH